MLEECDVDGAEYVVLEEWLDPVCIHVPSGCAVVPDGQFTGSAEYVVLEECDVEGAEYVVLEE